jgi:peptide deformylase
MKEVKDPIVQAGAVVLRHTAKSVTQKEFNSRKLKALITKMKKALRNEEYGVAIAAPQVDVSLRLFLVAGRVFEAESKNEERAEHVSMEDRVFINPELIRLSRKKAEMSEGCLSVRGKYGSVLRHERATVRAQDELGNTFTYHGSGLLAQIFQHEVEHLDGMLFIDKAERLWNDPDLVKND